MTVLVLNVGEKESDVTLKVIGLGWVVVCALVLVVGSLVVLVLVQRI